MSQARQRIRFLSTDDGAKLAWAEAGSGPLLVKAANWMTHLEFEWESPVWQHWLRFFSAHFHYVRYDERGCGLTESEVSDLSLDRWTKDLESVVDASRPEGPFALLGISQGAAACIAYAVRHPERVSHMILYGGYARGTFYRDNPDAAREYRLVIEAIRVGWGKENPAFRQLFTSRFIPEGTPEQMAWFNELCRRTTSADVASQLMKMRAKLNVTDLLERVRVPTLVIHGREDNVVPISEGRLLASAIRDAQFVELNSKNHVLLEDEPAWPRFQDAVLEFCGLRQTERRGDDPFTALSPREREILGLLTEGLANAEIGERLTISEKTVRNHISRIYDKLGVWTRPQAMVFARDRGFRV
ncbi:MAG TPA: alpha/beta fold hydrolase [Thermoanaerobaculia bacterium]|nr:alpha/beta fold hydrolase [Thermoanaerobaculia bacterium]